MSDITVSTAHDEHGNVFTYIWRKQGFNYNNTWSSDLWIPGIQNRQSIEEALVIEILKGNLQ